MNIIKKLGIAAAMSAALFASAAHADTVKIALNDTDRKRAKQIAKYPWFEKKRKWQAEIQRMLKNDFKLEVESLMSKDISYVTETYVPERLAAKDWLD